MFVVAVTVFVKPEFVELFIAATMANAQGTRKEAGNVRFDVHQALDDPHRFLLYEVYLTAEDFTRHQQTAHYTTWKTAVADWMAQPRQGVNHRSLFFGESSA